MSRILQAAVVGLGVGEQHARAFVSHPQTRLRWVYDLDGERMNRAVAALGAGRPASGFSALLDDRDLDVLALATYDQQHGAQVVAALDAGKHVFCEKPLCGTVAELRAIRQALARRPDRQLACNLVLRAAPLYGWLREIVQSGELGEIYAIDGEYLYGRIQKITDGWRGDDSRYSVFRGGGVHMMDLCMWITGQRPTTVTAVGNRIATRGTRFEHSDFVAATFGFESGMVGRVTANFGCVHRHQHVLRVYGTKGTFLYDDAGPRLHRSRDPEQRAEPLPLAALPASKGDLIPGFVSRILRAEQTQALDPETDHELAVMSACLGADLALNHDQPQTIEYLS
jgi:predicted dehydrogenase